MRRSGQFAVAIAAGVLTPALVSARVAAADEWVWGTYNVNTEMTVYDDSSETFYYFTYLDNGGLDVAPGSTTVFYQDRFGPEAPEIDELDLSLGAEATHYNSAGAEISNYTPTANYSCIAPGHTVFMCKQDSSYKESYSGTPFDIGTDAVFANAGNVVPSFSYSNFEIYP